jgi:hypothetical protein
VSKPNKEKRPCRNCGHETRSAGGLCLRCKPAPTVSRDGNGIHIAGIGHLSTDAALRLAHAIADVVTP